MAVELSTAFYDVPTISTKLQQLTFFDDNHSQDAYDKNKIRFEKYKDNEGYEEPKSKVMPELTPSPTSPPPTTTEAFVVKIIKPDDYNRVLQHLRRFFFKDEPLNVNIDLLEGQDTCSQLVDFSLKNMDNGCSYMVLSQSNEVVGVSVNAVDRPTDCFEDDGDCGNEKFQKILNLLITVEKEVDIFNKFPNIDSVMNCKILSVDSNWRGRGIAKMLLDKTRDVARQEGYGLMRVDCTSHFSAKAIARLGFDCIYTKKYADYTDNGEVVFNPESPHTEVAVYVQRIIPLQKL